MIEILEWFWNTGAGDKHDLGLEHLERIVDAVRSYPDASYRMVLLDVDEPRVGLADACGEWVWVLWAGDPAADTRELIDAVAAASGE